RSIGSKQHDLGDDLIHPGESPIPRVILSVFRGVSGHRKRPFCDRAQISLPVAESTRRYRGILRRDAQKAIDRVEREPNPGQRPRCPTRISLALNPGYKSEHTVMQGFRKWVQNSNRETLPAWCAAPPPFSSRPRSQ